MSTGAVVAIVAVAGVVLLALLRWARDGRFRSRQGSGSTGDALSAVSVLVGTPWAGQLGDRATLLQFSSAFCGPCRTTRRTLAEVASVVPGVTHVEVDAEQHLDLVRALGVLRTPTTLVLDAGGREVRRAQGAPTKQAVVASLGELA